MEFKERHSALERRWGRVRFMRARLDEAEALAGALPQNKANIALRREVSRTTVYVKTLFELKVLWAHRWTLFALRTNLLKSK